MTPPLVTFIVATYLRADALQATLRSVVLQGHEDWEAIVIGDCCGPETAAAIAGVNDPRIRYYNLPERYGEQAGPNSAGLDLARGDYLVFLNHDDMLLRDHVSRCLGAIQISGATVFRSRFAVVRSVDVPAIGPPRPVFSDLTPLCGSNRVSRRYCDVEPASAWVVAAPLARGVGAWRSSLTLCRTSFLDWILRAERAGGRFECGEVVTGVQFRTHLGRSGRLYAAASAEHGAFLDSLTEGSVDAVRQQILDAVRRHSGNPGDATPASAWSRFRPLAAAVYQYSGLDVGPLIRHLRGESHGAWLRSSLKSRTGETPPPMPSLATFLADPERWRVI